MTFNYYEDWPGYFFKEVHTASKKTNIRILIKMPIWIFLSLLSSCFAKLPYHRTAPPSGLVPARLQHSIRFWSVSLFRCFSCHSSSWLYVDRDTMTFGCFMARCNSSTFDFILLRFTSFKGFIIRVNITFQHCFVKQKQEKIMSL